MTKPFDMIDSIDYPKATPVWKRAAIALAVYAEIVPQLRRFFAVNGARPIYARVQWRGNAYRVQARYVVANCGGQHMTVASCYVRP